MALRLSLRITWAGLEPISSERGLITNSVRGVWALTSLGVETRTVDPDDVAQEVGRVNEQSRDRSIQPDGGDGQESWQEQLIELLLEMSPDAFERLCSRMLRESGFIEVTVTGRSGDGGVDGHGIIRMGGLISFPVLFQCKRFRGSVTPSLVRDFRGAMAGRSDKGAVYYYGKLHSRRKA